MSHFQITGGVALCGEVRCGGSKNAALPIMAASILASQPVRLEGTPRLTDVRTQTRLLRHLGVNVSPVEEGMILETVDPQPVRAPQRLVRRMRAGFCVLGPLLARRGKAVVPLPGGCNIGQRPVDLHLKGLAALGADLRLQHGYVVAAAQRLTGATIDLSGPNGTTVTGTANVLSAAVLARGVTVIRNAAIEPEIVDLEKFLAALGARIEGVGTSTLRIEGVERLGGATHRLIPDRIEAATLLLAAAVTGGSATVTGVVPEHLGAVLQTLHAAGAVIDVGEDWVSIGRERERGQVHFSAENVAQPPSAVPICPGQPRAAVPQGPVPSRRLRAVDVVARPYPGFPTDLQAQWTALAAVADGASRIEDRVFPGRFMHVAELNRLGANITCGNGVAVVSGAERLSGARTTAHDLRAGAALLLAALAAEGRTTVDRVHHIDRGYQRLDDKLRQLGARIERVENQPWNSAIPKPVAASFSGASRLASGHPSRMASSR